MHTQVDGFSLFAVIIDYITEICESHFTEKIHFKNCSQWKSVNK
jgi:phage-related holin